MTNLFPIEYGDYVDLEKMPNGRLKISLNAEGQTQLPVFDSIRDEHGIDFALLQIIEDHLCNGWELIAPEEIGALTSALIVSDEVERDTYGDLIACGMVYWNPQYAVMDEIAQLRQSGYVLFHPT